MYATESGRPTLGYPTLKAGQFIKHAGRIFKVQYVNTTRAYCVPVTAKGQTVLTNPVTGHARTLNQYGDGVSICPTAAVETVDPSTLNDQERLRAMSIEAQTGEEAPAGASLVPPKTNGKAPGAKAKTTSHKSEARPLGTKAPAKAKKASADKKAEKALKAAERRAKEEARKEAQAKAKADRKAARAATPRKSTKEVKPCACGCKEETTSYFVQGHDARFKGWLLKIERGQMEVKDLPKSVQSTYKWVKRGDGYIPTTNYKGEPHKGYDR
jgi:hypothetical protein